MTKDEYKTFYPKKPSEKKQGWIIAMAQ